MAEHWAVSAPLETIVRPSAPCADEAHRVSLSDLVAKLTCRHPGRHGCGRDVILRCAGHFRGMKRGRQLAVAGLSLDEKAVWDRSYSSAYKRAWTAASNALKLTRRQERRGDVVGSSSGLPSIPKEVAMVTAHEELSRFSGARDPSPRAPTVTATTSAVPQLPLPSPPYVAIGDVTAPPPRPPPASPSASSPHPPDSRSNSPPSPPLSDGEALDLVDSASVCGAGAPNLRRALAVCGAVASPQAVLVRSVDAALPAFRCVDNMRTGTWALSGPLDMVRKALMKGGAGFWVLGGGVGAEQVVVALGEAADIVRVLLVVIFNTTVAAEATGRGANGDCGRRQLGLDAGCLARHGLVPGLRAGLATMDGMYSVLAHIFSAPYFSYSPVLRFSEPGAAQQLAHTDAARVSLVGAGAPRILGGLLAIQDDTRLLAWTGSQLTTVESEGGTSMGAEAGSARGWGTGGAKRGRKALGRVGRTRGKGRAQVVALVVDKEAMYAATEEESFVLRVPVGCLAVFRGDAVHACSGNSFQTPHWRMHVYLLCEDFSELEFFKDTTIVAS